MAASVLILFIVTNFLNIECQVQKNAIKKEHFVFWPNGIIPFYIDSRHFDKEQRLAIMSSLARFTFETCLQFKPVFEEPKPDKHVMVFENPHGIRKCVIDKKGHSKEEPHRITIGFECLSPPHIDMMIMKALGFPFEHNRASRDIYIDVLFENIEQGAIELFTKERILPVELRELPYDVNSVLHFSDRDYSKNGHRTFIFKNLNTHQNRVGLSPSDLQKIDIIYGSECQNRDRLAKMDICKNYPVHKRRKREVSKIGIVQESVTNLRINRDIYPADSVTNDAEKTIKDLGIEEEVQDLIEKVHKISATALKLAKNKHCSNNKTNVLSDNLIANNDIIHIVTSVSNYIKTIVTDATANLTIFCDSEMKQHEKCGRSQWCPRSTKLGPVQHHTQHRPTKHHGHDINPESHDMFRTGNITLSDSPRTKREVAESEKKNEKVEKNSKATKLPMAKNETDLVTNTQNGKNSEVTNDKVEKNSKATESPIAKNETDLVKHIREMIKNRRKYFEDYRPKNSKAKRPRLPKTVPLSRENKEFYGERIWPEGVVPYLIQENTKYNLDDVRQRLDRVNQILKAYTCVHLEEIREENKYPDYLVLDTSADFITGRVGGRQQFGVLELFEGGQHRQHAAMLVMAMLGFYFELARHDRDEYVRVHMRHIRPDKLHHFEKLRSDATLSLPYDYKSATHPAWQFWRKIGKTGISTVATYIDKDPDGKIMKSLGQNARLLSKLDLVKINSVYGTDCFENEN